ncbi:MAG: lipopolysaccharide assembly protein LapA domain-containing protein, partial [bacterium]
LKIIFLFILVLLFVVLGIQNPKPIAMDFFSWHSPEVPLIFIIIISMIVGMVIVSLIGIFRQFRLSREIKRLEDLIDKQNEELKSFRNIDIVETEEFPKEDI